MSARFFAIESLFLIICSNIDLLKGQVELNLPVLHLKVLQATPLLHLSHSLPTSYHERSKRGHLSRQAFQGHECTDDSFSHLPISREYTHALNAPSSPVVHYTPIYAQSILRKEYASPQNYEMIRVAALARLGGRASETQGTVGWPKWGVGFAERHE